MPKAFATHVGTSYCGLEAGDGVAGKGRASPCLPGRTCGVYRGEGSATLACFGPAICVSFTPEERGGFWPPTDAQSAREPPEKKMTEEEEEKEKEAEKKTTRG